MTLLPKKKFYLFVGSDLIAHIEMCAAVKHLVENHFEPVLFYPKPLPSPNPNASQQIFKDYAFVERLILPQIYAELNKNPANSKSLPTPHQIAQRYRLEEPKMVDNINDPAFYEKLGEDPDHVLSLSMRCTQMFKPAIVEALTKNGQPLINVHSGPLPHYRGLYSTPRAMYDFISNPDAALARKAGNYGCTVHHVDPFVPVAGDQLGRYNGIDTGNIIDLRVNRVDPTETVYATNVKMAGMAAEAIRNAIDSFIRGGASALDGYPQKETDSAYYSYAGPGELKQWSNAGLTLFHPDEVAEILTDTFTDWKTRASMRKVIEGALGNYFGDRDPSIEESLARDASANALAPKKPDGDKGPSGNFGKAAAAAAVGRPGRRAASAAQPNTASGGVHHANLVTATSRPS